jgi:ubiquinone/menaquinone biosynthesis C-methylase UbiE
MSNNTYIPALRYNWLTRFYDFLMGNTFPEKKIKQALIEQCFFEGYERILHFGVGTATLSIMAKQQFPSIKITGIDVDSKILEIAKNKVNGKVQVLQYDGSHILLPDRSIDKIISSLVFHHISTANKKIVLKELQRVLKPRGELHIADFGKGNNLYAKLTFRIFRRMDGEENTRVNASGLLSSFISDAGFSDIQETTNFNTAFGTVVLIKAAKHEPEPFASNPTI